MTATLMFPLFRVNVRVKRRTRIKYLDPEVRACSLLVNGGTVSYYVSAPDPEVAEDTALDVFHKTIAVPDLDGFSITANTAIQLSQHELLAWVEKNGHEIAGSGIEVFDA